MHCKTSRRTFIKGLTAAGLLGGLGLWRLPAFAATPWALPGELKGTEFDLGGYRS